MDANVDKILDFRANRGLGSDIDSVLVFNLIHCGIIQIEFKSDGFFLNCLGYMHNP